MNGAPFTLTSLVTAALQGRLSWTFLGSSIRTDPEVQSVSADTRRIGPGDIFVCVVGRTHDGHELAASALEAGAVALVVSRPLPHPVPQVVVTDTRMALGLLCAAVAGWPSEQLDVVGVTGTNGKTSTARLLAHLLRTVGRPTSVLGTLEGPLTTPEAPELQQWLAQRVVEHDRGVVLEVSSHALELDRVEGIRFALGVFTNLGQDHLDFHGTVERYFAAKARLFEPQRCEIGLVNRDDVHGRLLADAAPVPMATFGIDDISDVVVGSADLRYRWRGRDVRVPLGGGFHVMNSLAALSSATLLGVDEADAVQAMSSVTQVPGRFQVIERPGSPVVIVDFAHSPDSLEQLLGSARSLVRGGRLVVVFGCGGDRDVAKRPMMGEVAARLADAIVLTSDNPRSEDPQAIVNAIRRGVDAMDASRLELVDIDRGHAIRSALASTTPCDVVVVAGKGHEATQTIGSTVTPFSDVDTICSILDDLHGARFAQGGAA